MARRGSHRNRQARQYRAVPVRAPHELEKLGRGTWIRPDHDPEPAIPLAEQVADRLVGPAKALLQTLIQRRTDELMNLEPDQPADDDHCDELHDALYTRAETEVFGWYERIRPTVRRLEREVFGPGKNTPKRGAPRRGPSDDALRAAFEKLPQSVRRSKASAAKRLRTRFPKVSVRTLRDRLAKLGKNPAAVP
jgi:hypothetical protein